jgi:hypothetical protein
MFRKIALVAVSAVALSAPLAVTPVAQAFPLPAPRPVTYRVYARYQGWVPGRWVVYRETHEFGRALATRDALRSRPGWRAYID